jgi:hypothetical protein
MGRICVFAPAATRTGAPAVEATANSHPPGTAGVAAVGVRVDGASAAAAPPCAADSPRQRRLAPALLVAESVSPQG